MPNGVAPSTFAASSDVGRLALQAGQHDQHHERRPLPDQHDGDRHGRVARDELDGRPAELLDDPVEDAVEAAEHLVLPDEPDDHGHQQERRDQQRAHQALPEELAVEQQRERRPEHERAEDGEHRQLDAHHDGVAEELVAEQLAVVVQPDEVPRPGRHDPPVREAVIDAHHERDLREQDHDDQRRQQRQPPTPRLAQWMTTGLRRDRGGGPWPNRWCSWRQRCLGLRSLPADLRCDVLAVAQRGVDRRPSGDHRRELLGALVADVLELRHRRRTGPRAGPGACVVPGLSIGAAEIASSVGLANAFGGLLVLGDLVGRLAGARRDRRPATGDLRPGLLDVLRAGRERDVLPGEVLLGRRLRDRERPRPQPARGLGLVDRGSARSRSCPSPGCRRPRAGRPRRSRRTTSPPCRPCTATGTR